MIRAYPDDAIQAAILSAAGDFEQRLRDAMGRYATRLLRRQHPDPANRTGDHGVIDISQTVAPKSDQLNADT